MLDEMKLRGLQSRASRTDGRIPAQIMPRELTELVAEVIAAREAIRKQTAALKLALPVLDEYLQTLCESYCPPCQQGELYDYSELKEPELGWITSAEAALDAVEAALKGEA